jgi:hypothetical protein
MQNAAILPRDQGEKCAGSSRTIGAIGNGPTQKSRSTQILPDPSTKPGVYAPDTTHNSHHKRNKFSENFILFNLLPSDTFIVSAFKKWTEKAVGIQPQQLASFENANSLLRIRYSVQQAGPAVRKRINSRNFLIQRSRAQHWSPAGVSIFRQKSNSGSPAHESRNLRRANFNYMTCIFLNVAADNDRAGVPLH